jgi:aspartate/methionine/tyrosine aminotransferase
MRLTNQLLHSYYEAEVDLAAGYPDVINADWLRDLVCTNDFSREVCRLSGKTYRRELQAWNSRVSDAVANFLQAPNLRSMSATLTASGAESIQRVFAMIRRSHKRIALPRPSLDLYFDFAYEAGLLTTYYDVPLDGDYYDVDHILDHISTNRPEALVLVAPNNPTGTTLKAEHLRSLLVACSRSNTILIIDACFVAIGEVSPYLSDIDCLEEFNNWLLLWDTGKTYFLDQRKLGIVWSSPNLCRTLIEEVRDITFDLPLATKMLMTEILERSRQARYQDELNSLINLNKSIVSSILGKVCKVNNPRFGSFCSLEEDTTHLHNFLTSDLLLRSTSVGTVDWNTFYPDEMNIDATAPSRVRLSLARGKSVVEDGATRIATYIKNCR